MGWTADHIPDQAGRVAVVTGANSGIGFHTARALVDHGGSVVMACRNEDRAKDARERIGESVQGADLRVEYVDLASLDSVADFAERIADLEIDILINNAATVAPTWRDTADGFESQLGINHLGHVALTGRLLDRLTPGSRIVTVTSDTYRRGRIDFDDLQSRSMYDPMEAYAQSKLANLLFANELARRLASTDRDILSVSAHPGYVDTNLQRRATRDSRLRRGLSRLAVTLFAQSPADGARSILYAATAPDVPQGAYVAPGGWSNMRGSPMVQTASSVATDPETAHRLWTRSLELTDVRYGLSDPGEPADSTGVEI